MTATDRPTKLLLAAMGGEGGGVLTSWIVAAAEAEGLIVQSTSIPGVAQRTGATTYYIELMAGNGGAPVMALYPGVGDVDVMVASELVEAGRAMQNGFVTPDRTTLIASTHRSYSMIERTAMGDGRVDASRVERAAQEMAKQAVLFDMAAAAREAGTVINAVMLGAIAGSGALPLSMAAIEAAISGSGKAVDSNLAGFRLGYAQAKGERAADVPADEKRALLSDRPTAESLLERAAQTFPAASQANLREGVNRLIDYQDPAYAKLYLDRLDAVREAAEDDDIVIEAGRFLALRMSYEDVIRVAQAKTRPERIAKVRQEVRAKGDEPVVVTEFLKPGIDEFASVLPPALARWLIAWADRRGIKAKLHVGLHIKSSTISGYLLMRTLAGLRRFRRRGYRYAEEQTAIDAWLDRVVRAVRIDADLAREVIACANLIKGYSDTHRRGTENFDGIMATLVDPTLAGEMDPASATAAIRGAREAALADPEGGALRDALSAPPVAKLAAE